MSELMKMAVWSVYTFVKLVAWRDCYKVCMFTDGWWCGQSECMLSLCVCGHLPADGSFACRWRHIRCYSTSLFTVLCKQSDV